MRLGSVTLLIAVKTQYGLMQRREMLLRISDTYQDQTTGWNTVSELLFLCGTVILLLCVGHTTNLNAFFFQPFAPTNYDWVLIRDLEPHHGSSSSKKMSAGGVLLLIAFFGLLTYFVAGISMNY